MNVITRYNSDPLFKKLVNNMERVIACGKFTPLSIITNIDNIIKKNKFTSSEIKEAAIYAGIRYNPMNAIEVHIDEKLEKILRVINKKYNEE